MLTGPVKSGKTDVLHLVLPCIIAREHSSSKRRPVIVRFTYDLRQGPEMAALRLIRKVKTAAAALGIPIAVHIDDTPGSAFDNVDDILGSLADALLKINAELWLLMDECQVRRMGVHTFHRWVMYCICI